MANFNKNDNNNLPCGSGQLLHSNQLYWMQTCSVLEDVKEHMLAAKTLNVEFGFHITLAGQTALSCASSFGKSILNKQAYEDYLVYERTFYEQLRELIQNEVFCVQLQNEVIKCLGQGARFYDAFCYTIGVKLN